MMQDKLDSLDLDEDQHFRATELLQGEYPQTNFPSLNTQRCKRWLIEMDLHEEMFFSCCLIWILEFITELFSLLDLKKHKHICSSYEFWFIIMLDSAC